MKVAAFELVPQIDRAARIAGCLKLSRQTEWQIDRDLIQNRTFREKSNVRRQKVEASDERQTIGKG